LVKLNIFLVYLPLNATKFIANYSIKNSARNKISLKNMLCRRSSHSRRAHLKSRHPTPSMSHGWDGDRLVCTQTDASKVHTVYEPGSFVPLLRISESMGAGSPLTEAQATEANARGLLALASKHGKPEKAVNPDDKPKEPIKLPGFGAAQWAALSKSFAHLAEKGYPEHIKTVLRQGGLDPDNITAMAKAAVAQQQAEQTAKLTIQMYHCNHLGTPIALINTQGMIDWAIELDPWENVLNEFNPNGIDQPIRMQGQQIDRESGLFYNRHRYYDPAMGRYITQDPIGLAGGFNNYCYPTNPMQMVDPLGLEGEAGLAGMQGRVDAAQSGGLGVRPGGVKVALGGVEAKGALGTDSPTKNTSTAKTQQKASKSLTVYEKGKTCTEEEVSAGAGSWKWMKQKFEKFGRLGDSNANVAVTGPGVSADILCVDPGQALKNGTGAAVDGFINSDGAAMRSVNKAYINRTTNLDAAIKASGG
jgi:RHS repeat-associated protein